MEHFASAGLLSSNLLVCLLIWFRLTVIDRTQVYLLIALLFTGYGAALATHILLVNNFIYLFLIVQFIVMVRRMENWLSPAIFFTIQLSAIMFIWILTFDSPRILFPGFSESITQPSIFIGLLILQNLLLLGAYLLAKKINVRTGFWNFLVDRPKKNRLLGLTVLLIVISLAGFHGSLAWSKQWIPAMYTAMILAIVCVLLVIVLHKSINNEKNLKELKELTEVYNVEAQKNELTAEFRHDFSSLLISLTSCLEEQDIQQAKQLLTQIRSESADFLDTTSYSATLKLNNAPLQGLLIHFYQQCEEQNIKVHSSLGPLPESLPVELIDLIRSCSILLNNAVEEVKQLPEDKREIDLSILDDQEGHIRLRVENPTRKKIAVEQLLKKGVSTKKGHQGIGLHYIQKLSQRSPHLSFYVRQTNQIFHAELVITYLVEK